MVQVFLKEEEGRSGRDGEGGQLFDIDGILSRAANIIGSADAVENGHLATDKESHFRDCPVRITNIFEQLDVEKRKEHLV